MVQDPLIIAGNNFTRNSLVFMSIQQSHASLDADLSLRLAQFVGYPFVKLLYFADMPQMAHYCFDTNIKSRCYLSRCFHYRFQFIINLVIRASTIFVCEINISRMKAVEPMKHCSFVGSVSSPIKLLFFDYNAIESRT